MWPTATRSDGLSLSGRSVAAPHTHHQAPSATAATRPSLQNHPPRAGPRRTCSTSSEAFVGKVDLVAGPLGLVKAEQGNDTEQLVEIHLSTAGVTDVGYCDQFDDDDNDFHKHSPPDRFQIKQKCIRGIIQYQSKQSIFPLGLLKKLSIVAKIDHTSLSFGVSF
ncbi:hypothetical protein KIN20_031888 [Parelaphostrongylus tenuis]|uniref:Uncharacterized protein n=1 Tax=Parelaphostrongylus tenuis TaxID=148309 RepID=A0AAD5WH36_PARTN|nr:hypothetical protein KIN20_031888 [Parelaphostrongylus tenuis]